MHTLGISRRILDKIFIEVENHQTLATAALTEFKEYIQTETQALSLEFKDSIVDGVEVDMDEFVLRMKLSKK